MIIIKKHLISILFGFIAISSYGQDPIFSQFYNASNMINPAFVGNTQSPLIATNYRNQWAGFSSVYSTYMVSYDQFLSRFNSGFGLTLLSDDSGDGALKTSKLSGLYSYRIYVRPETYVKIGMELGLVQSRLDPSKLIFFDQLDPEFGAVSSGGTTLPTAENFSGLDNRFYADVGAGILLYNPLYYVGLGMKHLNNPDNGFLTNIEDVDRGLPIRYTLSGGLQFDLDVDNRKYLTPFISPNLIYVQQGDFRQLNVGAYVDFGFFFLGGWYRTTSQNSDAVIGSLGVRSGIFKISYSYDLTVSGLGVDSGGSHELGIILNFDALLPKESKYNDCFGLFR